MSRWLLLRIGSKCSNIGTDGDVLEITFTTVKVQNFDNTTTTIPIYPINNECF